MIWKNYILNFYNFPTFLGKFISFIRKKPALCLSELGENCKPTHLNLLLNLIDISGFFSEITNIFIGFAHLLYM